MKNSNFSFLLFLLVIAVIPRNTSNATPAVVPAKAGSIIDGVSLLKDVIETVNKLTSTKYDSLLAEIESIDYPVSEVRKQVLENLYRTEDRVVRVRGVLKNLATQMKTQANGLIQIYEDNPDDTSADLLNYSVTRFVKLAKNVKIALEEAIKILADSQDIFAKTKSLLVDYNAELKNIENELKKKIKDYKIGSIVSWVGVALPICVPCAIASGITMEALKSKTKNHLTSVVKLEGHISGLLDKNEQLRTYVQSELLLIDNWKGALQTSLSDHEDGITSLDIKYGITLIKNNLKDLVKACDAYLANELPENLKP